MKQAIIGAFAIAAACLTNGSALAGENLSFTIHNQSNFVISAFQSNEGDG